MTHRTSTPPTGLPVQRPAYDPEAHVITNPALSKWASKRKAA